MNKKTSFLIIILIILIAVGAYLGYYFGYQKGYKEEGKIGAREAVTNPMENMPSTNPFEKVVNPFEEGYKNPFK